MKIYGMVALIVLIAACKSETSSKQNEGDKSHEHHAGDSRQTMRETYGYADSVNDGLIPADTMKSSPRRTAMATIAGAHIHIDYGSPGVKGRTIWGGLVAYYAVWAAGAHKATNITFSKSVEINRVKVEKGVYGFFVIPGREKWTAILNTRYDQHLADEYTEKEDVVRMELQPATHPLTQRLSYKVIAGQGRNGQIQMMWDSVTIAIPFAVLPD